MNTPQKSFIRIIGVVFVCIAIFVSFYFSQNQEIKQSILQTDYLCKLKINNLNVGEFGQQILEKQSECSLANKFSLLINYNWVIYLLGTCLFIFGVYSSLGDKK